MTVEKLSISDGFRLGLGFILGLAVASPIIGLVYAFIAFVLAGLAVIIGG